MVADASTATHDLTGAPVDLVLWIVAGVLAAAFALAGATKLLTPREKLLANPNMAWTGDFTAAQVKLIGLVEVLGAFGLVLPPLLDVAEWLVPLAAAGLALTMVGAYSTHVRRNDPPASRIPPIVLGLLALLLAVGRYWIEPL
jgi:VIT1/CCC1 family predicted Fe2+/Mn2+ transporter